MNEKQLENQKITKEIRNCNSCISLWKKKKILCAHHTYIVKRFHGLI